MRLWPAWRAGPKSLGCDMRKGQPTPGNIEGGLSSIEEKSLGAIVKSGTRPIQGVMEYTDRVGDRKGLWIKDTPGREPEILTGMACTGAQLMMFSTGRGAPQGLPHHAGGEGLRKPHYLPEYGK